MNNRWARELPKKFLQANFSFIIKTEAWHWTATQWREYSVGLQHKNIENLTQRMVKLWSEVVELKKWSKMVKLQRWTKGGQLKARQGAAHGESEEGGGASGFFPNWKAIEGALSALSASYIAHKTWHLAAIIFLCGDTLWDQFLHRLWVTNKNVLP